MNNLRHEVDELVQHELQAANDQLVRYGVDTLKGEARFVGPHEVEIVGPDGPSLVWADKIVIACGSRAARPSSIPFDGRVVFTADEIFNLERIPHLMIVIGGGTTSIEYATLFAALGVRVTVVEGREELLDSCDRQIVDTLLDEARAMGVVFRLGEDAIGVDRLPNGKAAACLESGEQICGDTVLVCVGRVGNTDGLNLQAAGLQPDERGRLWCNDDHQTWTGHIYAAGGVVGYPPRAGVSMEQGTHEVCCAFDASCGLPEHVASVLFTMPEIAFVGRNEEELIRDGVPYEVEVVRFPDVPSDPFSNLQLTKLLFHRDTRELLGVHALGEMAAEIVQVGCTVMALGGSVDSFRDLTFRDARVAEPDFTEEMVTA